MSDKDPRIGYRPESFLFLTLISTSIILFALAIIYQTQYGNRAVGLANQTYQRTTVCILSVTPAKRTDVYIQHCYDLAEKATGQKIYRYDIER